ncbi:MAG: acetyltransferase [Chitinophagales bacterium]
MEELLIFPYNGNGLEALDCLGKNFSFIGFVDDTKEKQGTTPTGFSVMDRSAFEKHPNAKVLAVPGSPTSYTIRKQIIDSLGIPQSRFATVIHPRASVSENAQVGINCLIYAGVVITANARVGNHVCVLPNTVIHHDSSIGDYTLIGSNICIAGYTTVGNNCYIGSGSNIINNIQIGDNVLIGMGSNVIKNIENNTKVVGNPARII